MPRVLACSLVAACYVLSGSNLFAQAAARPQLREYQWEPIGPTGGFIAAVAFQPGSPSTVLLSGDDDSGLYRSSDGGARFELIRHAPMESSVYGFAFDPGNPAVVYGYSHFGRGVLKSQDGGRSYQDMSNGLPYDRIFDLSIDPLNPQHLVVATSPALYESLDGAQSFQALPPGGPNTTFSALSQHAAAPGVLFVGTQELDGSGRVYALVGGQWQLRTTLPGPVSQIAQSSNAVYASTAGGSIYAANTAGGSWQRIARGAEFGTPDINSLFWTRLAVVEGATAADDMVYVAAWTQRGFFRGSQSASGWTWFQAGADLDWTPGTGNYGFSLAVNPADSKDVFFGSIGGGLYRTRDGGGTFSYLDGPFLCTDSLGLALDASNPKRLLVSSTEGFSGTPGIYETLDGGRHWSALPLTTDVMRLWISPLNPDVIVAGVLNEGLIRSVDGGQTWSTALTSQAKLLDVWQLTDHPTPGWVMASLASTSGSYDPAAGLYRSKDQGATWERLNASQSTCVSVDPLTPSIMMLGGFGVELSTDGGASWTAAPGFSSKVLLSLAVDPHNPGTFYAGGLSGDVYKSSDWGQTAQQLPTGTVESFITAILVDPDRPGVVYVANAGLDASITPNTTYGLLRSVDDGASFRVLNDGLFPGRAIFSLRFAPWSTREIYAGMWGGGTWKLRVWSYR